MTRNILPGRFAILMWLAIAWLLAVALDTAMTCIPRRWTIAAPAVAIVCVWYRSYRDRRHRHHTSP